MVDIRRGLYRHYRTQDLVVVEMVGTEWVSFRRITRDNTPASPFEHRRITEFNEVIPYCDATSFEEVFARGYAYVRRYERLPDDLQLEEYL